MPRILAIDLGKKYTGLAISDPEQRWAFGRGSVTGDLRVVIKQINQLIQEEEVNRLVVGLPIPMTQSSKISEQEKFVREAAEIIRKETALPLEFEEERLSSQAGARLDRVAGKKQKDDETAAKLILQSYLDRRLRL
ncbi:MAG: Holliday junction resolvase RuvX [bacterium]